MFGVAKFVSLLAWLYCFHLGLRPKLCFDSWLGLLPLPWPPWPRACVNCFDSCVGQDMAIPQTFFFRKFGWCRMIYRCVLILPFHCEHIPKVRAAPQFKWFYYSRVFDDFDIDVMMMMMSTRSAEFVVRSCAAPPPSPSGKPWKTVFRFWGDTGAFY